MYNPYRITLDELNETYNLITTQYNDAIKTMIRNQFPYLKYDFFSKLSDWSSENEFRIILAKSNGKDAVKLKNINTAIEGIVLGSNTKPLYTDLLKYICKGFDEILDIRKIIYEDNTQTHKQKLDLSLF